MKILTLSIFCLSTLCFLSGCNTVEGLGEDLQKGSQAVKKAASSKKSSS